MYTDKVTVNGYTFALVNGIWELLPNKQDICGIVGNVGNQWYYHKNVQGRVTTKGRYKSYIEAMQALTS